MFLTDASIFTNSTIKNFLSKYHLMWTFAVTFAIISKLWSLERSQSNEGAAFKARGPFFIIRIEYI